MCVMNARVALIALLLSVVCASGCDKGNAGGSSSASRELNVLAWSEYIPQEVLDGFAGENHVKINLDVVASNEDMLAKLTSGATKYDVIQPSEYLVEELVKMNRLAPLDRANVPNLDANILPEFKDQSFDPGNKYTVPYMSGTVGIVYNAEKVKGPIDGFADVFKPEHAGRIIVLKDNREIVTWAMICQKIPINEMTPQNLAKVKPMLAEWVKLIKKYDSDSPKTDLLQGTVDIGIVWNGEAALVISQDKRFKFVMPAEGSHRYIDNLAIPADATNKGLAHAFLNHCLQPGVSKKISDVWPYTNPNGAARKLLSDDQRDNPASYPEMKGFQTFHDIGKQAADVDKLMTELQSSAG